LAAKPFFLPITLGFLEDLTGATSRRATNKHVLAKMSTAFLGDFGPIAAIIEIGFTVKSA